MHRPNVLAAILAVTFILGSLPAMAAPRDANDPTILKEVEVTANKMQENIHKVPQSISVIDAAKIEEQGLKNSMDVINLIPGMLSTPDHGVGVTFRGLKRSMFTENNPVVIYVDGVPIANSFGFDFSLANIDRIEVLRGPQGTLYGKDAIGAVINVITKDPDAVWHGKIGTEYGSWNTWNTQASINGPIMEDKLFIGVSGEYDRTDGWIKNEHPGMNEDLVRTNKYDLDGYLLFTPTDSLRVRLGAGFWQEQLHNTEMGKVLPYGPGGYYDLNDFDRDMAEKQAIDIEGNPKTTNNDQNLAVSYEFDSFKVESITTHRMRTFKGIMDGDGSAGTLFDGLIMFSDSDLTTWTEELRMSSTNPTGFRWVGGVYLDKEEEEGSMGMQVPGAMMFAPVDIEMNSVADMETRTLAAFGQVMVPLGQYLELTLGGRYQRIKKDMDQDMYMLPVQGPFVADITGVAPAFSQNLNKTWNTFLPKAALAWFIQDHYTAYASYSQGYMPGGFNYFSSGGNADANTFKPQKSTNYEIGIKADYDTWRLNLAAFYMDITDIHIYKTVGGMWTTDNADKAHSQGVELEGIWLPLKGLELSASASIMQAKYDDYDLGTVKLDGEHMEGAPNHALHLGASYHHPSGLYGRADLHHVGRVHYYDDITKSLQRADAYTLADVKLGWLYENWDIYAFVKNLGDEEYINAFKANPMIGGVAGFGDPRSFGVGLSYSF